MTAPKPQGSNVHLAFHADELAYLRARAAAEERSVPWVVRRLVREAMGVSNAVSGKNKIDTEAVLEWLDGAKP